VIKQIIVLPIDKEPHKVAPQKHIILSIVPKRAAETKVSKVHYL